MKVRKVIDIETPGLGAKIREAREADSRSLLSICKEIDLTPMYWYKIEAEDVKALPIETLRKIEEVLGVNFGINFESQE
jgi:transcriptional regulator with XRE-family HTH domain